MDWSSPPTPWLHALALLFGLVLPSLTALRHLPRRGPRLAPHGSAAAFPRRLETEQKIAIYWSNSFVLALFAAGVVAAWLGAGRTLGELGLTAPPERWGPGLGLAGLFLLAYAFDTRRQLHPPERLARTRERWRRDTPFMPATPREIRHSLAMVTSAAVCEEIVFRGFLIRYVESYCGDAPAGATLAVALPAAVFAVCHFYQGARAVLKIALLAGLFGAIFAVTGSLWIPIVLHFFVDLVGSMLGPRLLGPVTGGETAAAVTLEEAP